MSKDKALEQSLKSGREEVAPVPSARAGHATGKHPLFGAMKGLIRIEDDTDLTAPADPEWGSR